MTTNKKVVRQLQLAEHQRRLLSLAATRPLCARRVNGAAGILSSSSP